MHDAADSRLLTSFRDGDREAFAVLVARHEGLVRAACRRQAPAADVDDCVQAVFLVLARRPRAALRAPALPAWLLRVAWYVCSRSQRADRRRRRAEGVAAQAQPAARPPEILEQLDACLARLPERQRLAVSLHYLAQKAPDEIAAVLGVSRDNAYQLVSRGLATLRILLARRGVAVSSATLTAALATEAVAATSGSAASIATTLTAMPTTGATTLAHGAGTAMTLASLVPFASAAAAALLTVGVALAETSPPPAPTRLTGTTHIIRDGTYVIVPRPADGEAPARHPFDLRHADPQMRIALGQQVTAEFDENHVDDAIDFARSISGQNIVLTPAARIATRERNVTLQVRDVPLAELLVATCTRAGLTLTIADGALLIDLESSREPEPTAPTAPAPATPIEAPGPASAAG